MLSSARRSIIYPNPLRGDSADVPRDFLAVINALEIDVIYGQGTLASRPTSTAGTPGIVGRVYFATDVSPQTLYWDFGTGWQSIGAVAAGSIGTTQLADGSVTGGSGVGAKIAATTIIAANIVANTITAAQIAAGTITATEIANALKPSAGAGAGTEALRALGVGAANATAGNDSRLSDQRTPVDASVTSAKLAAQGQTSSAIAYTLVLADRFKLIVMSNGGAVALTVPPNSAQAFSVGDSVDVIQWGAGQVTLTPGAGVTLVGNPGLKTIGQYAMVTLIKMATDTWVAVGALTP